MSCYYKLIPKMPNIYEHIVCISIYAVDFYVRFRHMLKCKLYEIYYYNSWTIMTTNYMLSIYNHVYYSWFSISVEPELSPWLNVSYVSRINTPEYLLNRVKPIIYIDLPPFSMMECLIDWVQGGQKQICNEEYQFKEQYVNCTECIQEANVIDRWTQMTSLIMCDTYTKSGIIVAPDRVLCIYKTILDQYIFRISTNIPSKTESLWSEGRSPSTTNSAGNFVFRNEERVWEIKDLSNLQLEDLQRSKIRFLSIEYTHPKMSHTIPLELHQEMLYVGNHLFSAAFVARMLHYVMGRNNFVFDMDYVIKIMDKDLKYFELTYCQYICLEKTEYKIITEK